MVLQWWMAYIDHTDRLWRMRRYHSHGSLSFWGHGGMWGDIFLISPLLAVWMSAFSPIWFDRVQAVNTVLVMGLGLILSVLAHVWYVWNSEHTTSVHASRRRLTTAGMVHLFYMGLGFAGIIKFYFLTGHSLISFGLAIVSSIVIGIHVPLGTHFLKAFIKLVDGDATKMKSREMWGTILTVWALLIWRTWVIINDR